MQEKRYTIADALELRLSYTNPSIYTYIHYYKYSINDMLIHTIVILFGSAYLILPYADTLTHWGLVIPYGAIEFAQH